jgi:hypothetical protein
MDIHKATKKYEAWVAQQATLVRPDLQFKHEQMAASPFPFLRATYYRWAQLWPEVCGDAVKAPRVLAVGDLHVENFGTWRDIEGRLIWGVNDFDEASELPYSNDLVRLAVSAMLATAEDQLRIPAKEACDAILAGYKKGLTERGRPFVLSEEHSWLRQIAESELRDPVHFWGKMDSLPIAKNAVPVSARQALKQLMPADKLQMRLVCRRAGLGSLGRQRFVALANWCGGRIAREAKALLPSACYWACGQGKPAEIMYQVIIDQAIRCPDPFVHLCGHWIVRRLSPHCSRIELASLPDARDELHLLRAMGFETANIHLGTPTAPREILRDLNKRRSNWLYSAARDMRKAMERDWKEWRNS